MNGINITHLNTIIDQFPDQYREIMWLTLKGMKPGIIATHLSLSEITVRRYQRTAGLYIRKHLDHVLDNTIGLLLYEK